MTFSLSEMWGTMGLPAKIVGGLLLTMGLASLTVFIERLMALRRSRVAAKRFLTEAGDDLRAGHLGSVLAEAARHPHGHLPRLIHAGVSLYQQARATHDGGGLAPVERTRRHVERHLELLGADLRRGLAVLASVGSVAPFVGLLGTVLGIISAFQGISATGSGGLSSVAGGISEALIETALGLAVAIPAVLAFNYLSQQIEREDALLTNAFGELVDLLEGLGEAHETHPRPALRHERVA